MKKRMLAVAILATTLTLSSCGTICGGKITECQKTKPAPGEPKRQIRPAALLGDIFCGIIPLVVDAADGGLYKPCKTATK